MRNAIYVIEEEHANNSVCVCVFPCIYSYTAQHPPALCRFNFKGHFLVKLSRLTLFFTAANLNLGMNSKPSDGEHLKKCKPHQRAPLWIHMKMQLALTEATFLSGLDVNPLGFDYYKFFLFLGNEKKCFALTISSNIFFSDMRCTFLFNFIFISSVYCCHYCT